MDQNQKENESNTYKSPIKKWASLFVLSLALAIIIIDTTVLNVSISKIIEDLHTDIQSIQWVITTYSLVLAAFTITGGRLGDLFGRKRMFITGAILFALGSITAALSQNVQSLLIGWSIIEGIGAALMMPATASLLVANFHGRDRAVAFGVWGGIAAASSAIGPLLGGYLTTNFSWHYAFLINVGVVALLIALSFLVKESADTKEKHKLDLFGVILSSLGLASLVFGIIESSSYGWIYAKKTFEAFGYGYEFYGFSITIVSIILGLIILTLFVLWELNIEKKGKTPLISMGIFKNQVFTAGLVVTSFMALGQTGLTFSVPVFLQAVKGLNAFDTGLSLLPLSLALLVAAPASAFFSKWITSKRLIQLGVIINVISSYLLYTSLTVSADGWTLAPGLIVYGIGMGLIMAQISNVTLSAVNVNQAGEASGVNNTSRQLGATLGSAIIGAIFLSTLTASLVSGVNSSTVIPEKAKSTISSQVEKNSSELEFGGGNQSALSTLPKALIEEITTITHEATVDGAKDALFYTGIFSVMTLIATFFLPNVKSEGKKPEGAVAGH